MDKKQHTQNSSKSGVTPSQKKKLDELADRFEKLPETRKKVFDALMEKKLLTTKDVCDIMGVSQPTVRRWMARGEIKYVKLARYIRFPSEELFRLVQHEEAFTPAEVAKFLGIGIVAVRNMIHRGEIKAFRMSETGHYHVPRAEIERVMGGDIG